MANKKAQGQYMTPDRIVNMILDDVGFVDGFVLNKTIMEPSFGNGAFLENIINRIISESLKNNKHLDEIKDIIHSNVFGIEKDKVLYGKAITRLNNLLALYGIQDFDWSNNLICSDTLVEHVKFSEKFDYVVGNPPYVRIHNIPLEYRNVLKRFNFSDGTSDLYVIFYEIGIKMLNKNGKLGFISPNSFIKNTSQRKFRNFLIQNKYISALYDFKESKLFPDADTYACICILDKNKNNDFVEYKEYKTYELVVKSKISLKYFKTNLIDKAWLLGSDKDLVFLEENKSYPFKVQDIATVQNGIATNKDDVYIVSAFCDKELIRPYFGKHTDENITVYFKDKNGIIRDIESAMLHRCVKASKYDGLAKNTYVVFPYKDMGNDFVPLTESEFLSSFPLAYDYLLSYKSELIRRDLDTDTAWFLFGRSQGIKNSRFKKIVFKHIIRRNNPEITPYILDEDVVVYSGIYTTVNLNSVTNKLQHDDKLKCVLNIFHSYDFAKYCSIVGKDMSGGYVAISAKNIKYFGLTAI